MLLSVAGETFVFVAVCKCFFFNLHFNKKMVFTWDYRTVTYHEESFNVRSNRALWKEHIIIHLIWDVTLYVILQKRGSTGSKRQKAMSRLSVIQTINDKRTNILKDFLCSSFASKLMFAPLFDWIIIQWVLDYLKSLWVLYIHHVGFCWSLPTEIQTCTDKITHYWWFGIICQQGSWKKNVTNLNKLMKTSIMIRSSNTVTWIPLCLSSLEYLTILMVLKSVSDVRSRQLWRNVKELFSMSMTSWNETVWWSTWGKSSSKFECDLSARMTSRPEGVNIRLLGTALGYP